MTLRHCAAGLAALLLGVGVCFGSLTSPASALTANEPALADQWGMHMVGAPSAWSAGATGAGITIAVIDSGVDLGHEDLVDNVLPGRNEIDPTANAQDDHGHGTHVAGTAAGVTGNGRGITGVAPGGKILPIKVLGKDGSGSMATVNRALRYAADAGAQVINLSLGPDVKLDLLDLDGFAGSVNYAWSKGSIPVIASGNDALPVSGYSNLRAIIVTAVDRNDRSPDYANGAGGVGSATWGMAAPGGAGTDVAKDNILSTWFQPGTPNAYAYSAGTSMATPHVSGAAAVLRGLGLSPQQTVDRLLSTAKDLGASGRDTLYGSGRLDLARAIEGLTTSTPPATTIPPAAGGPASTAPPGPATTRPSRSSAATTAPPTPTTDGPPSTEPESTSAAETATTTTAPPALAEISSDGARPVDATDDGPPGPMVALGIVAALLVAVATGRAVSRRRAPTSK